MTRRKVDDQLSSSCNITYVSELFLTSLLGPYVEQYSYAVTPVKKANGHGSNAFYC